MILVEKFIPKILNFGHDIDAQNEDKIDHQDNNNRHKDNHVKDDHHKDDQDKGNHDKYNLFCIKKNVFAIWFSIWTEPHVFVFSWFLKLTHLL